jgi:hypothetical protein
MKKPFISHDEKVAKNVEKTTYPNFGRKDSTRRNRAKRIVELEALPAFDTLPTPNECLMLAEMVAMRRQLAELKRMK